MLRADVGLAVVIDQRDQVRVQGQVAVVMELADRDVQPVTDPDEDGGVVGDGGSVAGQAEPTAARRMPVVNVVILRSRVDGQRACMTTR
jgi:hypothetical protein